MRALAIWFLSSALGASLIAVLPEDLFGTGRLFSLSKGHGPSASDAIGIVVLLGGWAWFVQATWAAWLGRESRWPGIALAILAAACLVACLLSVSFDRDRAAILFGVAAAAMQIALAIIPHCFADKEAE